MCLCVKTPYLIDISDSLSLNTWATALLLFMNESATDINLGVTNKFFQVDELQIQNL